MRIFCIRRCLAHTRSSLCSCPCSSSLGMMGLDERKSDGFRFITALAKVHPLFVFFFRLCYALAFGVYLSSFLKDMICSPRPYAPPVARLSKKRAISSSVSRHETDYHPSCRKSSFRVRPSLDPFYELHVHGAISGLARVRSPSCWIPLDRSARDLGHRTCVVRLINCGR